jgi:hypothetical protein
LPNDRREGWRGRRHWLGIIHFLPIRAAFSSILGANPSAEEQDEAMEDGASLVNNVVHSFRLQSTTFDKKSYLTYLKVTPL